MVQKSCEEINLDVGCVEVSSIAQSELLHRYGPPRRID